MSVRGRTSNVPDLELDNKNSPEIQSIKDNSLEELKEKLEIARFHDDVEQNLECCLCPNSKTDKRLLILSSQIIISCLIILFCFYKLAQDDADEDNKIYITLLTSIFSYWSGKSTNSDSKN
jgi:hypothetical protein